MSTAVATPPAGPEARTGDPSPAARRAGWAGAALGVLAFFVAVPPLMLRTPVPSALLALAAAALGVLALRGGARRLGWWALVSAVFGVAGAVAATRSGEANLERVVAWGALAAAMLRFATPLVFAAIGGLFSERSGVINIGLEGMMLMGAFFAAWGAHVTGSWVPGLLIGMAAGGALALVHAVFSISLRADQIVSGTAVNLLALGVTGYLYIDIFGPQGTPDNLPEVPDVRLGFLSDVGFVGDVLGQINLMILLALVLVAVAVVVVFRTPAGLRLRAAGENPRAAETAGVSVVRTRYVAVVTSGLLAAAGGAYLSIGFLGSFTQNMTAGRGFIALAALIFGRWRPVGALAAALLFGFSSALAQRLPVFSPSGAVLFQALPYVLTIIAVAGLVGGSIAPAALGRPHDRR